MDKDESLIPVGEFCYRVVDLAEGEVLVFDPERFGKDLREADCTKSTKRILCPYWQATDYGTVRCNFLDVDACDGIEDETRARIVAHFGSEDAVDRIVRDWALPDEIKVCGINVDDDDEDEDED
ncbi:MAG TPA: hypothetical protein PLV48_14770 [Rhodocyclaceae bacterium]|nr:hypothetical protein [Rhodocyclaceae bacterium]HMV55320.1 hypothetical protein [Rhodocyclaceae bacterium]HMZ84925.1 hypothetical protein [Rhodocyclaceae bacterium]HNA05142.1 hypothetical protein [Rhodocyclaceae bacterium]